MTMDKNTLVDFNPRSREGSDFDPPIWNHGHRISIHAPAKGATKDPATERFINRFQSTLPRRERQRKVAPFTVKID